MATDTLVEDQIDDGQRLLDRLVQEGVVVRAACWAKPIDADRWSLYIASPLIDEKDPLEAYGRVLHALRSLKDVWIDSSDITLVGEKHPLTQALLDILRRFPTRTPPVSRLPSLGAISIEEVHIYRLTPVKVTIYGLVFRGEPSGALHLSFDPPNPDTTLTVESQGERKVYPAETGIDWVVGAPEGAILEQDEKGRRGLTWDWRGKRKQSTANEVWSFAKLGMNGFRFLREPSGSVP